MRCVVVCGGVKGEGCEVRVVKERSVRCVVVCGGVRGEGCRPAKSHALGVTLTPQSTISHSHAWTHPEWRNLTYTCSPAPPTSAYFQAN